MNTITAEFVLSDYYQPEDLWEDLPDEWDADTVLDHMEASGLDGFIMEALARGRWRITVTANGEEASLSPAVEP